MEQNAQEINLRELFADYVRAFQRMWRRVVILAIMGGLIFGFRAYSSYVPYYKASATFTINIRQEQYDGTSTNTSYFDNAAAEQMAITFPYILTSGVLQRIVAQELGVEAAMGVISANVVNSTNILTISVRDTDPERAYMTLQTVIENYPALSEVIVGKVNMTKLDETGVPTSPINSRDMMNSVTKGGILGAGVGLVWVGIVAVVRKTIRRESDCIKYVNKKCLGSIPFIHSKERSVKKIRHLNILNESLNQEFKEAIRIVRNKMERSAKEHSLKTILVTSALAGEGKSTIAVNLAIGLAQEGYQVALIDCDLRNPSDSEILNLAVEKGLIDYLNQKIALKDCVYRGDELGMSENMRFAYIPGGRAISDGANWLGSDRMRLLVETLREQMDYVILDSAPVGLLTDAGVIAQYADGAVFVIKKDYVRADYILSGMQHLLDNNTHLMGCILNGD